MNWRDVTLTEHMIEAAEVVGEAEVVIEFSQTVRGWFRVTVFEDLKGDDGERYFARAVEKDGRQIEALATGATPEAAATFCLREAGISLRRAHGA